MKKLGFSMSAGLVVLAAFCSPSFADGGKIPPNTGGGSFNINKDELPRADQFYHHRKKVQIVDEGPEITDVRPPLQAPNTLQVNIPPRQVTPGTNYVVGDPSGNSGGGPVQVPLSGNGLPQAGFQRYYKQNQANSALPQGSSTGGHAPVTAPVVAGPGNSAQKAVSGHVNPGHSQTQAASYPAYNQNSGGSNSGGVTGVGKVTGTIKSPLKSRLLDGK